MEQLPDLLAGFGAVLTLENLLWLVLGALLGTAVGVLPGLGSSMAVALLLPMTFTLSPIAALIMFAGVYFGGLFGDSISGILMNTPGNSTAIASTFEGHRMALSGRAPQALATSAIGAFIGGLLATVVVVFTVPLLAGLATSFGPPQYLALAVFAFIAISAVVSDSAIRGLCALLIGITLSFVGIDQITGTQRFTAGVPALFDGIHIVVITVSILALGEVLYLASRVGQADDNSLIKSKGRPFLSRSEFRKTLPAWLRGTAIGLPFGVIPAGGAEVPTLLSYGLERNIDKRSENPEFGKGAIRGVAAPEAAGNATAGTAMGALLALGLPTSATAALMLAAFQQYGMQPGPLIFERNGEVVWALLASLFIGLIVLLVLNLPFAPLWAQLLRIPKPYLYSGITVFACLGVYSASSSTVDLWLMIGLGLVGFCMRRYDVPLAPVMIGIILAPLAETSLRAAMQNSDNDWSVLASEPITITIYVLLALAIVWTVVRKVRQRGSRDF
ncbi:putative tricarboxylic transport membrane protein [Propionibacteriaceae bacterium ES.041]|uniref:tripartite tricarboxylate transporter permease n=1 Tax=Enemella evansiae TaxID=2016499 RepID=UPI000B970A5D|nr:tripartite tricarboxylate transporter permease [Enemella evansiae]OYN95010.1 tripartite tricarboxylate transporter TctA [Enemella evansiae]OYO04800.1 tripartite tricarboxylate transporter TctA [Enemella evansiae]OYO08951.1 tripartite tricarboxylate transporter TctA [Enemella evansiae]PFG66206.1 putative tricarboxylic transport membrane protein [Propionibacteriaceae bacterium ES.041]